MPRVNGLHHITAIAGPAQENLDFYAGVLGMRLVKRSVNQDDPGTYHLFYADAEGHPGTDLTFFPWAHAAPPRLGYGLATRTSLEVPAGSLDAWARRLERYGIAVDAIDMSFGDRALPFRDPHGLSLALVEPGKPMSRAFTPWDGSPVDGTQQIRGLYGAQIWERRTMHTTAFLLTALGFSEIGTDGAATRYGFENAAGVLDVIEKPDAGPGAWGGGSVHHLAWRVTDDAEQLVVRQQVTSAGAQATDVIDRFWFKSVYFREPGGVLFELATDGPGFAADEAPEHLGETLVLPPWLESSRPAIERALPQLDPPSS